MLFLPIIKGILVGLLIAIPTGPVGFLCVKRGLTREYRAAVVSALGSVAADLIFGLIAIFGVTSVSRFFTHEQHTIRFFGGLLLLYVGVKTYFDMPPDVIPGLEKYEHLGNMASTFSLTMTNPVQIITLPVVFAAIGTDVNPGHYGQAFLFLAGLAVGSCLTWVLLFTSLSFFRKYISAHHFDLINKISGVVIIGTGLFVLSTLVLH